MYLRSKKQGQPGRTGQKVHELRGHGDDGARGRGGGVGEGGEPEPWDFRSGIATNNSLIQGVIREAEVMSPYSQLSVR